MTITRRSRNILAAVGVVGACVACCTVPLLLPLVGGAALSGFTLWGLAPTQLGLVDAVLVVGIVGGATLASVQWWVRRRRKSCATVETGADGASCAVAGCDSGSECGCAKAAS